MKKIIILILTLFISISFSETKIGYIDSQIIMSEYEDVRQVQVELEKEQKRLQTEVKYLGVHLNKQQIFFLIK